MLVVGYQRKWTGPLWQEGVSTSVINYRKSYFEMSSRHVSCEEEKASAVRTLAPGSRALPNQLLVRSGVKMYSRLFWESQRPMLEVLHRPIVYIAEGCGKPGQGRREPLKCDTPSFSKVGNPGLGRGAILPRSKGPFRLAVPWRTFRGLDRT